MGVPEKNIFVIGRFRYIPSLRDDWEGPILWVLPKIFSLKW